MDDPYIIKDTGRVNLYSVKDISGKTVILKLCGSVYKDSICKNVFKYSCYGHCHRSSTVNPLLYGSICIWKNQISGKKYYFWNIACCTDGSIIFFILPQYLMIQKMGLLNTIPALFIPGLFSAFGTFLMRQFFMALPNELEDAARIDGCNHFMIFQELCFLL